jgi:DNA-directed RNA polymerase subunit RPC12/RpoP
MTVPMPRYTGAVIYVCPSCWGDLDHEGADHYWCPACQQTFYFTQVALYDAEGLDD